MTHPQGERGSIERLCRAAGVSRASYYRRALRQAPKASEMALRDLVQRLSLANPKYGARRITALVRREGWPVNHKRIERIRKADNLLCVPKKAFRPATTDSRHPWPIWPNLAGKLVPTGPDQLWVADITYVRLTEAFVYLAVILDAFSRKVVGWALENHLRAELALTALERALRSRQRDAGGLVHHSDRGVQYASGAYVQKLLEAKIQPSMSRIACPTDNAMAESFMKTLKAEEVDAQLYRDLDHARGDIGRFIDQVYNRQRLHSALGYRSPEEFEADQRDLSTPIHSPVDRLRRPTATTTTVAY
jgi:putative transposase